MSDFHPLIGRVFIGLALLFPVFLAAAPHA
jgi:hypothetical protein